MAVSRWAPLLSCLLLLAAAPQAARAQPAPAAPRAPGHAVPEYRPPEHRPPVHRPPEARQPEHRQPEHRPPERCLPYHPGHAPPPHPPVVHPPPHPPRQKPARAHPAAPPPPAPAQPAPAAAPAPPGKGSVTGLPIPRFAALRADDVNLRAGPGTQYPIDWVYKRRDLPVEIEREFDVWRLISDQDGIRGWVNQATLIARRGFVVTGAERTIRGSPDDQGRPVARLQVGVIGRLRACPAGSDWCEVQVRDYRGWLKREDFWGVLPGEVVQP